MLKLIEILTEAKKCHCSEEGLRDIVKGLNAEVIQLTDTQSQYTLTINLKKCSFKKLEGEINKKFADHLRTITDCGKDQAVVSVWKN